MGITAPDPALDDRVVSLRPPDERDLAAIDAGINDPEVIRWFGAPSSSAEDVLELNRRRWDDGTGPTFAVRERAGPCVGHVRVNVEPANELSLRVAERSGFARQGILTGHGEIDGREIDHVVFSLPDGVA